LHPHEAPGNRGAADFSGSRQGNDKEANDPVTPIVQEPDLCPKATEGKEDREEKDGADVFYADAEFGSKAMSRRHDKASDKGTKESANPN
jgi:hypothetical protein